MTATHLLRAAERLLTAILSPGVCFACGTEDAHALCADCRERLPRVPRPCCYCGQPNPLTDIVCPRCLLDPPRWQGLVAPFRYRGLARECLLRVKFGESPHLVKTLCAAALPAYRRTAPPPEALLPVPLHRQRLQQRGYNQAAEIAGELAAALDIPLDRRSLRRVRATASQSGLSASLRGANVRGAFACQPARAYRHVALIDDIVTTGATAAEITRLLHREGVEFVEVWALARAYPE